MTSGPSGRGSVGRQTTVVVNWRIGCLLIGVSEAAALLSVLHRVIVTDRNDLFSKFMVVVY